MTKNMIEELKSAVWDNGVEAIDDLLGYEHDVSEEEALEFYQKYCR